MEIMNGKLVSQQISEVLKLKTADLKKNNEKLPHLAAVLVGSNGASETYVASKIKHCDEIGFTSTLIRLPEDASESSLIEAVTALNNNIDVDGILVQLPLPAHINEQKIINLIDPEKDVDGFSPINTGRIVLGMEAYIPATPYGIMMLLEHYKIETSGKNAVVIGRSNIVGRPMSILLSLAGPFGNCTVTLCHSKTKNLSSICREADIIVAALGKPGFLTGDMVKDGAVIIDVGITRV
jgi:methylenetetrahydrofolate dehydrogenase (NADP+)/methenyltetrahydrofolate cyclohydrolase